MRYLLLVLLAGCQAESHRSPNEQLAQCRTISNTSSDLTRCLIIQGNWLADSALSEGLVLQKVIDSIQAVLDSADSARARMDYAAFQRALRTSAEQQATSVRIDSAFGMCLTRVLEAARDRVTGRFEGAVFDAGRPKCGQAWLDARRNAKLPARPVP